MDQDQAATIREESQSNPDPIHGNSCAGCKIITNNKNKGLEEWHIETKAIIFKNESGKKNIRFLTTIQAPNEIMKNEENKNFETIIFAGLNRFEQVCTQNDMTNTSQKETWKQK